MVILKFLKLLSFIIILNVIKVNCHTVEISSFSRVSKNSDSIIKQSHEGNGKSIKSFNSSLTLWNHNSTKPTNSKGVESAELKSVPEGRAIKSNYFSSFPNFVSNPVETSNNFKKENRFMVYPSYNPNNIDQTRYNTRFATGPIAQRRFSPSEAYAGTVYKVKHAAQEYDYSKPIVAEGPPSTAAPTVISMTPPQYLPPPPQYIPPSKFYHPIVVYPTTTTVKARSASTNIFLPTIQSFNDKTKREEVATTPKSSIANLSDFDKSINTSYVPSELHAIREAMESSYYINNELDNPLNENSNLEDLQRFPPNTNSIYLPQETKETIDLVDSYLPAPSGNLMNKLNKDSRDFFDYTTRKGIPDEDLQKFPPNVNSSYDSKSTQSTIELVNSYAPDPSGDFKNFKPLHTPLSTFDIGSIRDSSDFLNSHSIIPKENSQRHLNVDETTSLVIDLSATEMPENSDVLNSAEVPDISYIPPSNLHVFPPNLQSFYLPPEMMKHTSLINSYIPPPSGVKNILTDALTPPNTMLKLQPNAYYYAKPGGGNTNMKPMPPPPSMMDQMSMLEQPPSSLGMMDLAPESHDHSNHHHHHPWDYTDLIFDHDHDHHHHHIEETTTTTAAPEEPRVKKYSYYYLGRKLWYIPLYFTFWFCLYVAALIIRSIGRHKVDLPNHYSRSLHDLSHPELVEKINKMTNFAMIQIEDFKEKYL